MADTNEKVILRVEIDQSEAVQRSAQLSKEIKDLTMANKELAKAGKDTSAEYQENVRLTKMLKDEKAQLDRQIDLSIKAFSAESGSINQLRAEVSFLTMKYNDLSESERDNSETGKQLQASIKAKTDRLKELEGAVGDNRRSVGDYRGALRDVVGEMRNLDGPMGKVINHFVNLKSGTEKIAEGFNGAGVTFQGFNGILKASVIGIIIVAMASLYALFTQFQPVVDLVEQAMAGLNAAFQVLLNRLIEAGKGYLNVIIGYFQGLYNTGLAIVKLFKGDFSGALDTMKNSFNKFTDGIKQVGGAFNGMGKEMKDAAIGAAELTAKLQDLADAKLAQRLIDADASRQVTQLILQSKNRTLAEKERIALLEKASKIEKEAFEGRRKIASSEYEYAMNDAMRTSKLQKEQIEALMRNVKERGKIEDIQNGLKDEQLEKLVSLYEAQSKLEEESINLQEKITNRRAALEQEIRQDQERTVAARIEQQKKAAEHLAKITEKAKEDYEFYSKFSKEVEQKSLDELSAMLQDSSQEKLSLALDEANQLLGIRKLTSDEIAELATKEKDQQIAYINQIKDQTLAAEEAKRQAAISTAYAVLNAIGQISSLSGENAEAQKALAIANATISTYEGANKAFAQGGTLGFITGAAVIAAGLANVLKIATTDIPNLSRAAGGGSFMTKGPTMLMVGDNPGGIERIDVTPISGRGQTYVSPNSGLIRMAGGGSIVTGDGGYSARRTSQGIDFDAITRALERANVEVKVSEIDKSLKERQKVISISQL